MTKGEFKEVVRELELAYIRDNFFKAEGQIDLWYEMLGEGNKEILGEAIRNYISKNIFQPTIADIKNEYQRIIDGQNEIKSRLRDIYNRTKGTYPNTTLGESEEVQQKMAQDAMQAWWDLVKVCPIEERVRKAEEIEEETIRFVHDVESDTSRQKIPTLANFFRGER